MPNKTTQKEIKEFCNIPEEITREGRWLVFFEKEKLSFNHNLKGLLPDIEDYKFKVRIAELDSYKRSLKAKLQDHNDYTDIDVEVNYFDFNDNEINQLKANAKRNAYVVLLLSNQEYTVIGNHREPMSLEVVDKLRDNGKGRDSYTLKITGKTTIKTNWGILPEIKAKDYFRVLLYGNPIA